jgi:hypothetical protein
MYCPFPPMDCPGRCIKWCLSTVSQLQGDAVKGANQKPDSHRGGSPLLASLWLIESSYPSFISFPSSTCRSASSPLGPHGVLCKPSHPLHCLDAGSLRSKDHSTAYELQNAESYGSAECRTRGSHHSHEDTGMDGLT